MVGWQLASTSSHAMKKILINFAHPAKRKSTVNRGLLDAVSSLPNVTVNDLYQHYPDFLIDVEREQTLCETHDIIIFQHPLYWYSTPAIVKEWMDLVLEHGWAYGSQGNALKDKVTFQTISAGGDTSTYQASGANGFTINQLTSPFAATAHLCQRCADWARVRDLSSPSTRTIISTKRDTTDVQAFWRKRKWGPLHLGISEA